MSFHKTFSFFFNSIVIYLFLWIAAFYNFINQSESVSHSDASDSLRPHGLSWNSPDKNTREVCHSLLQGTFLIQADSSLSEPPGKPHLSICLLLDFEDVQGKFQRSQRQGAAPSADQAGHSMGMGKGICLPSRSRPLLPAGAYLSKGENLSQAPPQSLVLPRLKNGV